MPLVNKMSHVPTMLKADRSVFEQMLPVKTMLRDLNQKTSFVGILVFMSSCKFHAHLSMKEVLEPQGLSMGMFKVYALFGIFSGIKQKKGNKKNRETFDEFLVNSLGSKLCLFSDIINLIASLCY